MDRRLTILIAIICCIFATSIYCDDFNYGLKGGQIIAPDLYYFELEGTKVIGPDGRARYEKVIKQTDAQHYEDEGWILVDKTPNQSLGLYVDWKLPQNLTEGIYNMNPGYTILYRLKSSKDRTSQVTFRERLIKVDDMDECLLGIHNCHQFASCENRRNNEVRAGFVCKCHEGYSGNGTYCLPNDACAHVTCCPHSKCQNKKGGGHECVCDPDYKKSYDGGSEKCQYNCDLGKHGCLNADCWPVDGSFTCKCYEGYVRSKHNPNVCEKRNECNLKCDVNARCVPKGNEWQCICNPGYKGDGFTCKPEGDPVLRLSRGHHLTLTLGQRYTEYGYQIDDPGRDELDVSIVPESDLTQERLSKCGTFKVEYEIYDPIENKRYPPEIRRVTVVGTDLCALNDPYFYDIAPPCPERSRCKNIDNGCRTACECMPPFVQNGGTPTKPICIDPTPPVIVCPRNVIVKDCRICDFSIKELSTKISTEERSNRRKKEIGCVAYDVVQPDAPYVDRDEIQKKVDYMADIRSEKVANPNYSVADGERSINDIIRRPNVVELTSSITLLNERKIGENCSILTYGVTDKDGHTASTDVRFCIETNDYEDYKIRQERNEERISHIGSLIQLLFYAICGAVAWIIFIIFAEYGSRVWSFFIVVILGFAESDERARTGYGLQYRLTHPFATENQVKRYINKCTAQDEREYLVQTGDAEPEEGDIFLERRYYRILYRILLRPFSL